MNREYFHVPVGVPINLAGLDFEGDATQPCILIAPWFAGLRQSEIIEISDFLTAMYLLFGEKLSSYWTNVSACEAYLRRQPFPNRPREELIRQAVNERCAGIFSVPGTLISGWTPQTRGVIPSRMSGLLDQLLAQTQQIATSLRLSYPTAESILLCLLDNKQYGEDQNLRASGIDVRRLHGALEQNH
jgi:hypothetical protein